MNRADPAQARLQCRRVERAIVGRDRVQALDDVIEHPTMIGDGVRSTRRIVSGERAVAVAFSFSFSRHKGPKAPVGLPDALHARGDRLESPFRQSIDAVEHDHALKSRVPRELDHGAVAQKPGRRRRLRGVDIGKTPRMMDSQGPEPIPNPIPLRPRTDRIDVVGNLEFEERTVHLVFDLGDRVFEGWRA
ncbi:MAG TPA: hypothetical protein VFZ10_20605, partial [Geminicoccaceae bacterium]